MALRCAGNQVWLATYTKPTQTPLGIPMPRRVPSIAAFVFATGLLTAACDSTEPRGPGSIFISSSATQPEPNAQFFQYDIIVDNGTPRQAFVFEPVTYIYNGLAAGAHEVRLGGVPTTCNIGENPRRVSLRGDDTALVVFNIQCPRTTGDLQVSVTTTGPDPDPNGYLLLLGSLASISISTSFNQTLQFVPAGTYSISLSDVSANCSAGGAQSITITPGQTSTVSFAVTCTPVAIVKVVSATTGTERDVDGFLMTVGSGAPQRVPANGTVNLRATTGTSTWTLSDVQPNCALGGASSGSVTVAAGDTVTIDVSATCAAIGYGTAGTAATEAAADTLPNAQGNANPSHDLLQMTPRYAADWVILVMRFTRPVGVVGSTSQSGLNGVVDLDVDENAGTGAAPLINSFGGSASMGSDYRLDLFGSTATTARILRAQGGDTTAHFAPLSIEGDSVVVKIPLAKLGGDDGRMTISAVLGTFDRPTEIAPNSGVILARPEGALVAGVSTIRATGNSPVRKGPAEWPAKSFSEPGHRASHR